MTLKELIEWIESQDQDMVVRDGFSSPHSDRGDYCDLAFAPEETSKISDMLRHAKGAMGETFTGWKGGDFRMGEWTDVFIGEWGRCGESITSTTLKYWELTGVK